MDPLRAVLDIMILERDLGHRLSKQSHSSLLVVLAVMKNKKLESTRIQQRQEINQRWTLSSVIVVREFVERQVDALICHG